MKQANSYPLITLTLLALIAIGAACGTVETGDPDDDGTGDGDHRADGGGDPDDHEAPVITAVSPEPGATVTEDFAVVITFSEPMDAASVEAAIALPTRADPVFIWNADGDQLTLEPWARYPTGTDPSKRALDIAIGGEAADRSGNLLGAERALAYTLEYSRLSAVFPFTQTLSGNCYAGYSGTTPYSYFMAGENVSDPVHANRGFVTIPFDLPDDVVIDRAVLNTEIEYMRGDPFGFGDLAIDDVQFTAINGDSFAASGSGIGVLFAADPSPAVGDTVSLDITDEFADDYEHRAARSYRTQFRIRFPHDDPADPAYDRTHSDEVDDHVRLLRPETNVTVTYLVE